MILLSFISLENECNFYRLVSPNYNGIFEFSLAKNGNVSFFEVDCTYKPYNPYIHIVPEFGKLYGQNFDDARGLICNGDFSLSMITDQWKQYEINNKNYLNAFDRQITNMEINHKYQTIADIMGAIGGTAQGASYGAIAGSMAGAGPVAGAVVGGAASLAGGIADVILGKAMRQEQIDYTKDQFGYSLGNIRALPNTLNRVTSFNANNKIYPFLEYYSCTDEEKEALRNKLLYNGMTVMKIDNISNFLTNDLQYIKGKIIRLESISEDTNLVGDIFAEINEGVYVKWQ